jgi:hypothetical protein
MSAAQAPTVANVPAATRNGLLPNMGLYLIEERFFLAFLLGAMLLSAVLLPYSNAALWLGFMFAAYSAVANDSIQTIGTFIASNRGRPWWLLWAFVGGIFIVTMTIGWVVNNGDVAWGRLSGFPRPENPNYLQVIAPLFLLVLTRMRMPVSTTILLLTAFAPTSANVYGILSKSIGGYVLAFVLAAFVWGLGGRLMRRWFTGKPAFGWVVAQWFTTSVLWSVWLIQDAANIAVFLPRQLTSTEFILFSAVVLAGLAYMLYMGGERIQEVVDEKSDVVDTRPATIIDLVYAVVLILKTVSNTIPMSTTWVFIGLLGGRELAMSINRSGDGRSMQDAMVLMGRDITKATIGLVVSIILALSINPWIRCEWTGFCDDLPSERQTSTEGEVPALPPSSADDAATPTNGQQVSATLPTAGEVPSTQAPR